MTALVSALVYMHLMNPVTNLAPAIVRYRSPLVYITMPL